MIWSPTLACMIAPPFCDCFGHEDVLEVEATTRTEWAVPVADRPFSAAVTGAGGRTGGTSGPPYGTFGPPAGAAGSVHWEVTPRVVMGHGEADTEPRTV